MSAVPAAGRNVRDLGLCIVEESCRAAGHTAVRAVLPERSGEEAKSQEVCLDCTSAEGRLEGLRLWQSVCPCCFSTAFPDGLPSLAHAHASAAPRRAPGGAAPAPRGAGRPRA